MLGAVPQIVASILLIVLFSVFQKEWQTSSVGQVTAFFAFVLLQAGGVSLVLLSANTSLAATTTILVASCFAAAVLARPAIRFWRQRRSRQSSSQAQPSKKLGFF
jgi:energy-converting hydrogenase Eha subunit E